MSFIIATDSTADLPKEYLDKYDIFVFNLSYSIDGQNYGENHQMDIKEFYESLRAGNCANTSQINPDQAKKGLIELLKKGNDILYITFSSGLSGTYNSAKIAAEEISEEYEDANIIIFDSLSASMGEGLVVHKAVMMRESGATMSETVNWLNDHINNFVHLFTVDDLNHLFRGGRVSKSTAFFGSVLNIKPILKVDADGHLTPYINIRGRKKSLIKLVDDMEAKIGKFKDENDIIFISHCDSIEDAEFVKEEVTKRFGYTNFIINFIGPVVGAHSGPGTVALFFLGEER